MKYLFSIFLLLTMMPAAHAQSDYDVSTDSATGFKVFQGLMTFDDIKKEPTFDWFQRNADAYKPDTTTLKYLKKNLPAYSIVVLMGTWCDDSQNLIPQLYAVLKLSGYPMAQYTMFGVNHHKEAKYVEHKLYKLEKVPTIILYKNHQEVGRIVENVQKSIEGDLAEMIQKDRGE